MYLLSAVPLVFWVRAPLSASTASVWERSGRGGPSLTKKKFQAAA